MIIDLLAAVLLILAVFKGYSKGFVIALFSSVAVWIGMLGALKLSSTVSAHFQSEGHTSRWMPLLSFALVLFAIILLVRLGAQVLQKTVKVLQLGWLNRIAGMALYFLLYFTVYSIALYYLSKVELIKSETIAASETYAHIQPWGPTMVAWIGKVIPWVRNIFATLDNGFGRIGSH